MTINTGSLAPRYFYRFLVQAGLAIGALSGAVLAGIDLIGNACSISPAESVQLALWTALMGVALTVPVCVLAGAVCQRLLGMADALLIAAVATGIAAQCVLMLTLDGKWAVAAIPIPWVLAWGVYR